MAWKTSKTSSAKKVCGLCTQLKTNIKDGFCVKCTALKKKERMETVSLHNHVINEAIEDGFEVFYNLKEGKYVLCLALPALGEVRISPCFQKQTTLNERLLKATPEHFRTLFEKVLEWRKQNLSPRWLRTKELFFS